MNDTYEYFFFLLFTRKTPSLSVNVNDWQFWINDCIKVQLIVRLQANNIIVCLLDAIDCHTGNWFSISVNDQPLREIESIFVMFDCPEV